jgi:uncharacterized protein YbaP (TraB family)
MKAAKRSLLWEISGPQLPGPSFVFGTMHVRDQRAFENARLVLEKIESCKAFACEFDLNAAQHHPINTDVMLPPDQQLHRLLSPRKWEKLQHMALKGFQVDLRQIRHLRPLFLIQILTEQLLQKDMPFSLDEFLWRSAEEQGKQLLGIETLEEQEQIMIGLPLQQQIKALVQLVHNPGQLHRQLIHMTRLYQEQDIYRLYQSSRKSAGTMRKRVLLHRNFVMAERIGKHVLQRTQFSAIGAGHLAGGKGVLRLLKKQGLKIRPLH